MYAVSTFYKFVRLADIAELKASLKEFCLDRNLIGTILLAPEGINATIAGTKEAVDSLMLRLRQDPRFEDLETKDALTDQAPFGKLRVRLKKEIISIRDPEADPNRHVGELVPPGEWNALLDDPEVLLLDTRNSYEVAAGTFDKAVDPNLRTFGQFPQFVDSHLDPKSHKKVAMFCTGGIRCEKASALLLSRGFETVYHLQGGILKYLECVPPEESRFQGECFVFDNRETVTGSDLSRENNSGN